MVTTQVANWRSVQLTQVREDRAGQDAQGYAGIGAFERKRLGPSPGPALAQSDPGKSFAASDLTQKPQFSIVCAKQIEGLGVRSTPQRRQAPGAVFVRISGLNLARRDIQAGAFHYPPAAQ